MWEPRIHPSLILSSGIEAAQRDGRTGNNTQESEQPVSDEGKLRCGLRSQKHLQDGENRQADDGDQSECSDQTDEMIQSESHWETEQLFCELIKSLFYKNRVIFTHVPQSHRASVSSGVSVQL